MTNEDKILEILRTLQKDMTEVRKDITELKDGQAEIRSGVNTLLEWADNVGDSIEFPLPKIM